MCGKWSPYTEYQGQVRLLTYNSTGGRTKGERGIVVQTGNSKRGQTSQLKYGYRVLELAAKLVYVRTRRSHVTHMKCSEHYHLVVAPL